MSTEYTLLQALIGELSLRSNQVARDPRACQQLAAGVQKVLGMSSDEVVELLQKAYGYVGQEGDYIEKAAKDDPEPGPMKRLPLPDALARVSVHLVNINETTGWTLQCLRCGGQWSPEGYTAGDLRRPAGQHWWKCPRGCNSSAGPLPWDEGKPPSYNPLAEYRQP